MKHAFGNSFSDRRGGFQQAGLRLVNFFPGHCGLNLLDERSYGVDGGAIPLMASLGLACSSNRRFVNSGHRLLL